jgi:molybdenum cofactor cytidylyltransferase
VLAAGASRRLGSPKQLARWRGQPLVLHAVDLALDLAASREDVMAPVRVITGAHGDAVATALADRAAMAVANAAWASGMASSLRSAVGEAVAAQARALLVLLVDQPLITLADLERLHDAFQARPGQPAAAAHDSAGITLGAPTIFPAESFTALASMRGDRGARRLLREEAGRNRVTCVPMPSAAFDVDTPQDLRQLVDDGGSSSPP